MTLHNVAPNRQGGDMTIKLDDGMVLKARVRDLEIHAEPEYGSVETGNYHLHFETRDEYTFNGVFDGAYTIFNAPTAAHCARVSVTDTSIRGIGEAQRSVRAPDTAEIRIGKKNEHGQAQVTFTWEA